MGRSRFRIVDVINAYIMKRIVLILSVILHSLSMQGQLLHPDEIFYRTSQQSILCPSEKVYLHTDRSTYISGDTIWMRAHVVDGIAHVPMKQSAYVYVALQNPFLETVSHVRLKADKDGIIYGYISLPEDLPKGQYSLCAYTRYMQNFDSEYFFKKQISVNSLMNTDVRLDVNQRGRVLNFRIVNPATETMTDVRNCAVRTVSGELFVSRQDSGYSVRVFEKKDKVVLVQAGNYREFVDVGDDSDYDVSFLPEGGNLVSGSFNRIAFKCLNSQGQGEDIIGTLRDENDSVIISFKSLYRGMGVISFIPQKGKRYTAVCENVNGVQKSFNLPLANDKYTMQVNQIKGKVYVKVLFSADSDHEEKLLVVAHQRGWPVKVGDWQKKTPGLVCNVEDFIEGVASFLLVNESGQIVSERMVFIQNARALTGQVRSSVYSPGKREKVILNLNVSDKWWNGDCSVSVTDNHDVQPDSCTNLLSSLLLSSDLRGHIECPSWYFKRDGNDSIMILRRQALDALMMTQGWRKYDLSKAWARVYKEKEVPAEHSQKISGKVIRALAQTPIRRAKVQMMIPVVGGYEETKTKDDGTFCFEDFDAPDSTVYWISAYTEKGKDNVVLELDTVSHPVLAEKIPAIRNRNGFTGKGVSFDFISKSNLKVIQNQGIRHLFMDELIVTAPKIEFETEYEKLQENKTTKEEEIAKSGAPDMLTLLYQKIPSFRMASRYDEEEEEYIYDIMIRNTPVLVMLDDVMLNPLMGGTDNMYAMEAINSLRPEQIAQIDVIKGAQAVGFHSKATGGVIAITTKRGHEKYNASWSPTNLKHIMPLGFQLPVEFYSTRYELSVDKEKTEPDLRTTIHWQPRLEVKNGKAEIEFYTAEGPVDYSVVIEGVGEDGSLLRVEKRID